MWLMWATAPSLQVVLSPVPSQGSPTQAAGQDDPLLPDAPSRVPGIVVSSVVTVLESDNASIASSTETVRYMSGAGDKCDVHGGNPTTGQDKGVGSSTSGASYRAPDPVFSSTSDFVGSSV